MTTFRRTFTLTAVPGMRDPPRLVSQPTCRTPGFGPGFAPPDREIIRTGAAVTRGPGRAVGSRVDEPRPGRQYAPAAGEAPRTFRVPPVPTRSARSRPLRDGRPRRPGHHADRQRQEPLLPVARPRTGRNDGRRQPADRADEGPG